MERKKLNYGDRPTELKKGYVEVGPGGQKLLHCPHEGCDKVLTSSPGLRYHMRTHYGNDRPYLCTRCKKTFKSANGLKYHTEKTRCEASADLQSSSRLRITVDENQPDDEEVDVVSSQPLDIQRWRQRTISDSSGYLTISPVPYQTGLNSLDQEEICDPLTQLAIIATGPQSPLVYGNNRHRILTDFQRASQSFNASIHSYAKPPPRNSPIISRKRSLSFSGPDSNFTNPSTSFSSGSGSDTESLAATDEGIEDTSSATSSGSNEIDPLSFSSDESDSASLDSPDNWPAPTWLCFLRGAKVRFENSPADEWLVIGEEELKDSFAPSGLLLVQIISESPNLHLKFRPYNVPQSLAVIAQLQRNHPFFVKDKGWCSCYPTLTEGKYGVTCATLAEGDVCLPPTHHDAAATRRAIRKLNTYRFTAEDTNAVYTLSQMAAKTQSKTKASSRAPLKTAVRKLPRSMEDLRNTYQKKKLSAKAVLVSRAAKRPMNAFMLYAKKFRLEYTAMHPGKDNRAISVLLGDKWKKLRKEERKAYSEEARKLAEQYRKQNPDCWKRKRSVSESVIV